MSDSSSGNGGLRRTDGEIRIGVYVCHCGTNIAGYVDVPAVVEFAKSLPNVVLAREYTFMCSDPGQELVRNDIVEHNLNRVVVAACSPLMHEPTFRRACEEAGLNGFLMQMANIREQCSWVTDDKQRATEKSERIIRAAVMRVAHHAELDVREVPVTPRVLILGGGIAGIEAALQIADAGREVVLVERESSIGGKMAMLDKTFPTLDCAACILTPKMVQVGQHRRITLRSYAEIDNVSGYIGSFKVRIRNKPRMVDPIKCNGCGQCYQDCPAIVSPRERVIAFEGRKTWEGVYGESGRAYTWELRKDPSRKLKASEAKERHECILCGRCAKICSELVKANAIEFARESDDEGGKAVRYLRFTGSCIGCGACVAECPTGAITLEDARGRKVLHHEATLGPNRAITMPSLQSVPNVPYVDKATCIHFMTGGCLKCAEVCPKDAVNHGMADEYEEFEVGAILLATGYQTMDVSQMAHYGYGVYDNVITGLEFEKLIHASGPTGGKILMANGQPPKSIAILHCIGSRDENYRPYCSRVCCMMSMKFAHLIRERTHARVYQLYIDIRAAGKGYEEFYKRCLSEDVVYIRGKAAEITNWAQSPDEEGKLIVRVEDTLLGELRRLPVDMVILSQALEPQYDARRIAQIVGIGCGAEGWFPEKHPKLAPVHTATDGVYLAGACQYPKDIPDSVAQGAAAASNILSLMDQGAFSIEPITAWIDPELCGRCRICINMCPYQAISYSEEQRSAVVESAQCKGCGTCVAACPSGAAQQAGYTDAQIRAELEGALGILDQ